MDPAGRDEVLELARDLAHNKGMSLLFSSHLLPDVEAVCDHVVVLGRGRLLAQGRIEELKQAARPAVRGAGQGRPGAVRRPAGGAGLHGRAARRPPARRAARGPDAASSSGRPRPSRASRSATCGRSAARSKKSSSTPWRNRLMPIFDQGYQHWYGHALGPRLALAGDHPARRARRSSKNRWRRGSSSSVAWLPAARAGGVPGRLGAARAEVEPARRRSCSSSRACPTSSAPARKAYRVDGLDAGVQPVLRRRARSSR